MLDCSTLNTAQSEAVLTDAGPLLVLAGAGSGKTRVLTFRIAHLVEDLGVDPWNILAVTFTNKAAKEMRDRLEKLIGPRTRGMWIYTFHSMCVRILRANAEAMGYTQDFTIYDTDDSKRLIKEVMADLGYSGREHSEGLYRARISQAKNELISPDKYLEHYTDAKSKATQEIYQAYQRRLKRSNAMDFDDLLLNTYRLLKGHSNIRDMYSDKFQHILVDEYQDTNKAQYEITKMLASKHGNLMVVGDDDQSIYSWRGADIRNILDFERDWPETKIVKLEENYRSTATILQCANAVIAHNQSRKPKELFTNGEQGEKVAVFYAADERDEGRWIASEVEKLKIEGASYNDIAVFYRTNAQSRILEDMFLRAGVPYRIVGGTRFYERAEIRDVMAYLKLVVNHADEVSALRIINTPRRGIGKTTVERNSLTAMQRGITFFDAVREESLDPGCRPSTRRALASFVELIEEASNYEGDLYDVVDMIISKTDLIGALEAQNTDEAQARIENIQEFMGVVAEYVSDHELVPVIHEGMDLNVDDEEIEMRPPTLADFMEWLSLRTDLDSLGQDDLETVTFMTVHSAKGLEFDNVFVAGMEESVFPHRVSMEEHGLEEERRLAYVAITRARKRLYLTCAARRRLYNDLVANPQSRFIQEMPQELLISEGVGSLGLTGMGWEKRGDRRGISGSGQGEEMYGGRVYGSGGYSSGSSSRDDSLKAKEPAASIEFTEGDRVDHKTFGPGVVKGVDGDKISIYFKKSGKTKTLLKGYAPIVKVN